MVVYVVKMMITMIMVYQFNKKNDTKYNPVLYGIYAFLFGIAFSISMFYGKYHKDMGEKERSEGCYIAACILFIINIIDILYALYTVL